MTDDLHRIRKLIRPVPLSIRWMDEHWELMRYALTLAVVVGVWTVAGFVAALILLIMGWRP